MKVTSILLLGLTSLLVLALLMSFVMPSRGHAEVIILIHEPAARIMEEITTPRKVAQWNVFSRSGPEPLYRFTGPGSGVGAGYSWKREVGSRDSGQYRIIRILGEREADFTIRIQQRSETGSFELRPAGDGSTWVKWIMDWHAGIWPWERFYALAYPTVMEPAMASGISALKKQSGDLNPD